MTIQQRDYYALTKRIDAGECEVTAWEASFLESILRRPDAPLSPKQQAILRQMGERYLPEEEMAEFYGQQRLL